MTPLSQFAVILLAAGFSRRMAGENKLTKVLDGRPLIAHALETIAGLGAGQLIVVLGESADAIAPLLPPSATVLRNARAAQGMGSSLAAGAGAVDSSLSGVFVALADMPFVAGADYQRLAQAFLASGGEAICIPVHAGQRGHPVLFRARDLPALAALGGDRGARAILADPQNPTREVEGVSSGTITDFDDQASFAAHKAYPPKAGPT
jgi:molybdenum cofactor cytidylyltransferase